MTASYKISECYLGGWCCHFYVGGDLNYDERGTSGTGLKIYETKEKAEAAGKRYLKKMGANGFSI